MPYDQAPALLIPVLLPSPVEIAPAVKAAWGGAQPRSRQSILAGLCTRAGSSDRGSSSDWPQFIFENLVPSGLFRREPALTVQLVRIYLGRCIVGTMQLRWLKTAAQP